jgi:FkbM family methyltransferase
MDQKLDVNYYHFSPFEAVGYMQWHLEALKRRGFEPERVLDIGAAHGHFADFFRSVFPKARVTCVECNELDKHYLEGKYDTRFVCLGKEACTKTFYLNPADPVGGGSSFYRENTQAFDQVHQLEKEIMTLDSLALGAFDLIKLDTQGSEIDVIDGGRETIGAARFVLIECSFLPYNDGGCLIDDVVAKMRELGFRMFDTFGPTHGGHCWGDQKIQADVLFIKDGDPLISFSG